MGSIARPELFARLDGAQRVLIAGAGGGFDVFAGLPLALALRDQGKDVAFASYSFGDLGAVGNDAWIGPGVALVTAELNVHPYFPELTLARWLAERGIDSPVHAFAPAGAVPLREAYRALVARLGLDAVVLVDGGTDILLRGDEAGLGTPEEDMTSLAAVAGLDDVPHRFVACLGFGIDAFHGVCHAHVLENIAALTRAGAYLGAFSLTADSPEGRAYVDAVAFAAAHTPTRPSIVQGQVAAAVSGEFGNVQFTHRTAASELFVNPLMGLYFTFELVGLAASVQYLDDLRETRTTRQVALVIERYRYELDRTRPRRVFPH